MVQAVGGEDLKRRGATSKGKSPIDRRIERHEWTIYAGLEGKQMQIEGFALWLLGYQVLVTRLSEIFQSYPKPGYDCNDYPHRQAAA